MYKIKLIIQSNKFLTNNEFKKDISLSVRELTVRKNVLLLNKKENYNIYQFDLQLDLDDYAYILNHLVIFQLHILDRENDSIQYVETYLSPYEIYYQDFDKKTKTIFCRVFARNIIVNEMLHDNGLLSNNIQNLIGGSINNIVIEQVINGENFIEFFDQIIQGCYGNSCKNLYLGYDYPLNKSITKVTTIPNLNTYESIKYYLTHYWPILGNPMFSIDDFYPKPTLLIKFDELITSNVIQNENLLYNINQTNINFKRFTRKDIFETSYPRIQIELINDIDLFNLKKISFSNIVVNNPNNIQIKYKPDARIYAYENSQLVFNLTQLNPFVTVIDANLSENDLNKFIELTKLISYLGKNYKISASPFIFNEYDVHQIFELHREDRIEKHFIYGLTINFKRSMSTIEYDLIDQNVNNYISKADIYSIEITNLPKTF
jgi:hypothetical protein